MKPHYWNGNSLLEQLSKFKSRLYAFLGVMLLICSNAALSATTLAVGDIAFVGTNLDSPDDFSFVLLKYIDATTEISFTDYDNGSGFNTSIAGDGEITWTSGSERY